MKKAIFAGLAIAAFIVSCTAAAQTAQPFRATSTEVELDLIVRDAQGRLVKNLKPGDVEIYEDGVRQQLLSLRPAGGRDAEKSDAKQNVRPLRIVQPVCIVFHNIDPSARKRVIEAVQEFLKTDLPAGSYTGVFVLEDRLFPVFPFMSDREALARAVEGAFSGRTLEFTRASELVFAADPNASTIATMVNNATSEARPAAELTAAGINTRAVAGADVSAGPGSQAARADQARARGTFSHIAGMREIDQMLAMIQELGSLPGPKTVLLVSTGLVTTGEPERFASILTGARQSGISIYALHARGLDEASTAQAAAMGLAGVAATSRSQSGAGGSLEAMRQKSRQVDEIRDTVRASDPQAGLRALAEGTGGFLIANSNDYRRPFQKIAEDLGSHYEAFYRPASERYDGRLRKIEVKTARPGLRVESRTGYFAVPDLPGRPTLPFESSALALLNAGQEPRGLEFRSAAFHFRSDAAGSQAVIAFELPAAGLGETLDPDSRTHRLHVALLALVKRADGQIVDKFSVDTPYHIPDAHFAAARASAITYAHPLSLPPGRYTLETAVLDREGRRSSTGRMQFEIPEPRKGIGLSSVLLVDRVEPVDPKAASADPLVYEGRRAVPLLAPALKADAKPHTYFVVYPDPSRPEKPQIQVEFLVNGQVLAKQVADLPPANPSGAIPMMVAAVTRPGNCELRITALQGAASAAGSVKYAIEK